jgi:hypothetical protein
VSDVSGVKRKAPYTISPEVIQLEGEYTLPETAAKAKI